MKVCLIGWYGTETIGDRAILAGILAILSDVWDEVDVALGSLYPFFSERTVREDSELWEQFTNGRVNVTLFDSSRQAKLKGAIRQSDLLLIGGGPLMDLREMHMLDYAFRYAQRRKIRSGILGCGLGPLQHPVYRKAAARILATADFAIMRDRFSLEDARTLVGEERSGMHAAVDPAVYCAYRCKSIEEPVRRNEKVLINLRDVSFGYDDVQDCSGYFDLATRIVRTAADLNQDKNILLVPHHYFSSGGDDRIFLNRIKYHLSDRQIRVQNEPLSLRETMQMMAGSALCVGMRYHFILLSALMNGQCRIINYTGSRRGKIAGFLEDFDPQSFFDEHLALALDEERPDVDRLNLSVSADRFQPDEDRMLTAFDTFRSVLSADTRSV